MRVVTYELIPWKSGLTNAGLNEIHSNKLLLNGVCISGNVPAVIGNSNFIQIDICSECFEPGCSSGGYVQVIEEGDFVIWKEPYDKQTGISEESVQGLNGGTIYWDLTMYAVFLAELGWAVADKTIGLTIDQVIDLWRINAVNSLFPLSRSSFFYIERIEEDIVGFYSKDFNAEQSKDIYLSAKKRLLTTESSNITITELKETASKVVAMIDMQPYKEWDCVYYEDGVEFFPIGDNLVVRVE